MKINWGTGILFSIIIFMSITVFTGIFLMNQDVDLVANDYYDKEIKYQQHIDMLERTKKLNSNLNIEFDGSSITIFADEWLKKNKLSGKINFYRPSNSNDDKTINLKLDEKGTQFINIESLTKGFWRVRILWEMSGNTYYSERAITIE